MWKARTEPARPAHVAGTFYPDNPAQLRAVVDGLLLSSPPLAPSKPIYGLVVPHAGYVYSAQIAAKAYAAIKGKRYKRVVVIAPSHMEPLSYTSIFNGAAYTTPLGQIPVDRDFAERLAERSPSLRLSQAGHGCYAGRCEHAIEVQLPFLQQSVTDLKIVPIVMGTMDYPSSRALGVALASLIERDSETHEPDTLIVASSDLSHFHAYDKAAYLDRQALSSIASNDYLSLSVNFEQRVWEACGGAPIIATMIAVERMGALGRTILAYANSGDVTGEKERVVGYAAAAFSYDNVASQEGPPTDLMSGRDGQRLLSLAKESVERAVRNSKGKGSSQELPRPFQAPRGAFVTLKKEGQLRGCIGYITPSKPLVETVREVAASAALRDARFTPIQPQELNKLSYEVSVLSPLRRIADTSEIKIGRDGLLIRKGNQQGLLLPQVPTDLGWDVPQFVAQTALKAGLPPDAWRDEDTDLFAFSAQVIEETTEKSAE